MTSPVYADPSPVTPPASRLPGLPRLEMGCQGSVLRMTGRQLTTGNAQGKGAAK